MLTLEQIEQRLVQRRTEFQRRMGEAQAVNRHKKELEAEIARLGDEADILALAATVLQKLSADIQARFLGSVEGLITEGLTAVFGTTIEFKIEPVVRNRQVTLDFSLKNEDGTVTDIQDARGGGLISLCGVLFRLVMIRLMRDRVRQVLILDEPLAHLSEEYQPVAGELLAKLSKELDIQVLMVSHQPEINEYADVIWHLSASSNGIVAKREK